MSLEKWDPVRKKWILYWNEEQHRADCDRFPFEMIPRNIFLDTNVLNILVKRSDQIFEQSAMPIEIDKTATTDIEALMHLFYVGQRANWGLFASKKSIWEIEKIKDPRIKDEILEYTINFVDTTDESAVFSAQFGRRIVDSHFLAALPDLVDRELVGNAIGLGCDVFCTCDRRTIIKKREQLRQLPLRILTPEEWWAHVKPWAALWC